MKYKYKISANTKTIDNEFILHFKNIILLTLKESGHISLCEYYDAKEELYKINTKGNCL